MIEDAIVKVKEAEAQAEEVIAQAKREAAQIRHQAQEQAVKAKEEALLQADADKKRARQMAEDETSAVSASFAKEVDAQELAADQKRAALDAVIQLALK